MGVQINLLHEWSNKGTAYLRDLIQQMLEIAITLNNVSGITVV